MKIHLTTLIAFLLLLFSCNRSSNTEKIQENNQDSVDIANQNQTPGLGYEFKNNGKNHDAPLFNTYYKDTLLKNITIEFSENLDKALKGSERYLRRKNRKHQLSDSLTITDIQIKKTIKALKQWQKKGGELSDYVKTYQMEGEDSRGNMHFTGYYIPVLKVSKTKDDVYKYPLYQKPKSWKGKWPDRKAIDTDGALEGMGLELAYSDNLFENYSMHVQGSGVVEYPDGKRSLLKFGGKNGYGYKSLGKYLVAQDHVPADKISLSEIRNWLSENPDSLENVLNRNPSYVFFKELNAEPSGAASVPLVAKHSVAVSKKEIPLGSILLGEVPVLDENGVLIKHEYRILAAHDTGGAINKGHIDFFSGIGIEGEKVANALHHYGRIWLLVSE